SWASGSLLDSSHGQLVSLDHALGALLGGTGFWLVRRAYYRLRGREGLGFGDVKLAAAADAWTGWHDLPNVVLLAAAMALGLAIALAIARRKSLSGTERIPFGAFLAPSIWVVWSPKGLRASLARSDLPMRMRPCTEPRSNLRPAPWASDASVSDRAAS